MHRHLRTLIAVTASLGALVSTALAKLPAVLDVIPDDAALILASPSINSLNDNFTQLATVMGMAEITTPRDALAMLGLRQGLDLDGSVALVMLEGDFDAEPPSAVVVLPTRDYNKLLGGFDFQPGQGGAADRIKIEGEELYAKKIAGGYTIVAATEQFLKDFGSRGGRMAAHEAALGDTCQAALENCDVIAIANVAAFGDLIDEAFSDTPDEAFDQLGATPEEVSEQIKQNVEVIVSGVKIGAMGAGFEIAMRFKDGSEASQLCQGKGDTSSLLSSLPGGSFLIAFATDYTHPGLQNAIELLTTFQKEHGVETPGGDIGNEMMKNASGQAMVVFPNPDGPFAGVFAHTINYYRSQHAKDLLAMTRGMLEKLHDAQGGVFTGSYTQGETQIDGADVDGWSVQPTPGVSSPITSQLSRFSAILFGQGGMRGYMTASKSGVYQTLSKNTELMRKALGAGAGHQSMADNVVLKQIAERLPKDRLAEGYLSLRPILTQLLPLAAMFGAPINVELPDELPPIAGGVTADKGAVRFGVFAPAAVLKLGVEIGSSLNQINAGGAQHEEKDKGAPRF